MIIFCPLKHFFYSKILILFEFYQHVSRERIFFLICDFWKSFYSAIMRVISCLNYSKVVSKLVIGWKRLPRLLYWEFIFNLELFRWLSLFNNCWFFWSCCILFCARSIKFNFIPIFFFFKMNYFFSKLSIYFITLITSSFNFKITFKVLGFCLKNNSISLTKCCENSL